MIGRGYVDFIIAERRFLAFGFALTLFSSFGQTFFIALFGAEIRAEFGLSDGGFGLVYGIATLASGLCIIRLGRSIDHVDLRWYTALIIVGLVASCWLMSVAATVVWLGVAIFGLRITGQGLLGHTAMTSMARYYDKTRGTALSIAGLGFPAGEAVLPLLGVTLMLGVGWRSTWALIATGLLVATVPIALMLLRGHAARHAAHEAQLAVSSTPDPDVRPVRSWTRGEVLRDARFYLILPAILAPPFIVTGVFFHQTHLVETKGWTMTWFASCFVGFAATQLPTSLLIGPLIDRVSARRLAPFVLLPLGAALIVLGVTQHPMAALAFMLLAGVTSGGFGPVVSALWAEIYGVGALGAIRALATSIMVFATAASPALFGWLIELGFSMEVICGLSLGELLLGTALLTVVLTRQPPRVSTAPASSPTTSDAEPP